MIQQQNGGVADENTLALGRQTSHNVEIGGPMRNEFTAIFEQDGDWLIAYCPEIPGANGQGRTRVEARESLAAAIALILEDRREDMMRGLPANADTETVVVAA